MEIIDEYGSHEVPADYFTRGDHIENDHIHFPTGVDTHDVASDAELLADERWSLVAGRLNPE